MWKVTSNEQKVTINKQKVTSNEQNVTSNEQKLMSKEQQAKLSASVILDFGNWTWYYLRNYLLLKERDIVSDFVLASVLLTMNLY